MTYELQVVFYSVKFMLKGASIKKNWWGDGNQSWFKGLQHYPNQNVIQIDKHRADSQFL